MGFGDFLKGAINVANKEYNRQADNMADTMWRRYSVSELQDIANGYRDGNRAAARRALENHGYSW